MRTTFIVLLAVIAGCEKSGEKEVIKSKDGTIAIKGDQVDVKTKDGSLSIGTSELPDDFPIPVMSGAEIEGNTRMSQPDGLEVFQLSITSPAKVSQVAEFYEKVFKDKGVSVTRNEQSDKETQMVMLFGSGEGLDTSAVIARDRGEDQTNATISWSEKKK